MNNKEICFVSVILLLLLSVCNPAFAILGIPDNNQTSNDQPSTSTEQHFSLYKDPSGKFTIEYPTGWTITPKENRFQRIDVVFTAPGSSTNGRVAVSLSPPEDTIKSSVLSLPLLFEAFLNHFSPTVPDYQQVGEIDYSNYTVAGNDAAAVEYTSSSNGQIQGNFAGLFLFSVVNQRIFQLFYNADQNVYDTALPAVKHMIDSFQVTE